MKEVKKYFELLRFDKNFHLGLGDIRLTIAMQESVIRLAKEAAQQSVQRTAIACAVLGAFAGWVICRLVFGWLTRRR